MGTLQNGVTKVFHAIARACAELDCQLVLSLGGGLDPVDLGELAGDPIVVRSAPQLELLRRSTLTVCHGGLNTVLEALSHGMPIVAIPVTNDQPGIGVRLEATGAGVSIPVRRLTVDKLREATCRVLAEPRYRRAAGYLQTRIAAADGLNRAATIVEEALSLRGRSPV
jgi:zeaxanthin glucosyltransferase